MVTNLVMARLVLIAMLFTVLLASSQDIPSQACIDATLAIETATRCQGTDNLTVVCGRECGNLFNAVFDSCPGNVSFDVVTSYMHACIAI